MSHTYGSNQCSLTKEGLGCITAIIFAEPAARSHQWNSRGMWCLSAIKVTPPTNDNFWNRRNLKGMCVREYSGHFVVAKRKYVLKCCPLYLFVPKRKVIPVWLICHISQPLWMVYIMLSGINETGFQATSIWYDVIPAFGKLRHYVTHNPNCPIKHFIRGIN